MGEVLDFVRHQRNVQAFRSQRIMHARRLIGEAVAVLGAAGEHENEIALLLEDFAEHLLRECEARSCCPRPEVQPRPQ